MRRRLQLLLLLPAAAAADTIETTNPEAARRWEKRVSVSGAGSQRLLCTRPRANQLASYAV